MREAQAENSDAPRKPVKSTPGALVSSSGETFGGPFAATRENFLGRLMVDCWHASAKAVATMPGPSGTA
ncbi:hypothetical protein RCC30_01120 [Pseudomonas fluorescens]|nr:hypothetical protein RCC30_01120 [Pseudomonas fluorescens]